MTGNRSQTTSPRLTDTQRILLSEASQRADGAIVLPARLKGSAGNMAITALVRRGFAEISADGTSEAGRPGGDPHDRYYRITDLGLSALGIEASGKERQARPAADARKKRDRSEKPGARARPAGRKTAKPKQPARARTGKQHDLVTLLSRAKGATLDDLMKATGWQAHSVRGFLSGTVKARLGLKLQRIKDPKRGSVYRIPT